MNGAPSQSSSAGVRSARRAARVTRDAHDGAAAPATRRSLSRHRSSVVHRLDQQPMPCAANSLAGRGDATQLDVDGGDDQVGVRARSPQRAGGDERGVVAARQQHARLGRRPGRARRRSGRCRRPRQSARPAQGLDQRDRGGATGSGDQDPRWPVVSPTGLEAHADLRSRGSSILVTGHAGQRARLRRAGACHGAVVLDGADDLERLRVPRPRCEVSRPVAGAADHQLGFEIGCGRAGSRTGPGPRPSADDHVSIGTNLVGVKSFVADGDW